MSIEESHGNAENPHAHMAESPESLSASSLILLLQVRRLLRPLIQFFSIVLDVRHLPSNRGLDSVRHQHGRTS